MLDYFLCSNAVHYFLFQKEKKKQNVFTVIRNVGLFSLLRGSALFSFSKGKTTKCIYCNTRYWTIFFVTMQCTIFFFKRKKRKKKKKKKLNVFTVIRNVGLFSLLQCSALFSFSKGKELHVFTVIRDFLCYETLHYFLF